MWRRNLPKHTHAEKCTSICTPKLCCKANDWGKKRPGSNYFDDISFLSRLFNGRFCTKTTAGANIDLVVFYSFSTSFQGCKWAQTKWQNFCYKKLQTVSPSYSNSCVSPVSHFSILCSSEFNALKELLIFIYLELNN